MYTRKTLFAFVFVGFAALFSAFSLHAQECSHPDYNALTSFYTSTQGDTWVDNSGWLTDCEPCGWFGVNCDADGRVTSLILRGNALVGELPADIGNLDKLTILNLAYNKIGGTLPDALFTAAALRDINLTENSISGTLPTTLGDQLLLKNLRLSYNLLQGEVPAALANFLEMEILTLNNNSFTGTIPEGMGDLPEIFALDFSANDFAGCFPTDLSAFCGQSRIRFTGNPKLSWSGDFNSFCTNEFDEEQIGAPCDDGDPNTSGDVISLDCGCGGVEEPDGIIANSSGIISEANFTEEIGSLSSPDRINGLSAPNVLASAPAAQVVNVFPNPVVGNEVTVQLPVGVDGARLRLLSLTGRVISATAVTGNTTPLRVPELTPGVYLIETVTDQGRSVLRIVVN